MHREGKSVDTPGGQGHMGKTRHVSFLPRGRKGSLVLRWTSLLGGLGLTWVSQPRSAILGWSSWAALCRGVPAPAPGKSFESGVLSLTCPARQTLTSRILDLKSRAAVPGGNWSLLPRLRGSLNPQRICLASNVHAAAENLSKMEPIVMSDWVSYCFANSQTNGQTRLELVFLCWCLIKQQSYTVRDNGTVECRLELFSFMEA